MLVRRCAVLRCVWLQPEDYVHRIGRTGRAGARGESLTFLDKYKDRNFARHLVQVRPGRGWGQHTSVRVVAATLMYIVCVHPAF